MPSPERTPYTIRELTEVYRAAQERLGLYAAVETLDEWVGVNLVAPSTTGRWFTNLFGTVRTLRRLSRLLTYRYYNLARALGGGRSYSNPDGSTYENEVALSRLYADFGDILADVHDATAIPDTPSDHVPDSGQDQAPSADPQDVSDSAPTRHDQVTSRLDAIEDELVAQFRALEHDLGEDLVPVDDHHWDDPDVEDDFEEEYRKLLDEKLDELEKEIQQLERELNEDDDVTFEDEPTRLRDGIAALGQTKSYIVAGVTDGAVLLAGRGALEALGTDDKLVIKWARATGPKPCAFCAMLASRGPIYKTEASATAYYHLNCHCSAVPVYVTEPAMSARDQFFYDSWRDPETWKQGPSRQKVKQDSLNQWRRWLTRAYQEGRVPGQDA